MTSDSVCFSVLTIQTYKYEAIQLKARTVSKTDAKKITIFILSFIFRLLTQFFPSINRLKFPISFGFLLSLYDDSSNRRLKRNEGDNFDFIFSLSLYTAFVSFDFHSR